MLIFFIKQFGYAIFEYRENSNKPAGIVIAILAVFCLIVPIIATLI